MDTDIIKLTAQFVARNGVWHSCGPEVSMEYEPTSTKVCQLKARSS